MDEAFSATGESGSLTITPATVTVRTASRERVIPLQQVASVTLQHPGLGIGHLHLVLFGDMDFNRVLADWVEAGEAVTFRAAQYPAFDTARDYIERYRAALPPEPPSASGPFPGSTPPTSNPFPGFTLPTSSPLPGSTPPASGAYPGFTPSAPNPSWEPPSPAASPPEPGTSAQPGFPAAGTGPTLPPGIHNADAIQELLREHPEALQEFLRDPQQFMREHPDVVQEFLRLRQQQQVMRVTQRAGAGGVGGGGGTAGGASTGTTTGPTRRRSRGCLPGCLAVILVVVGLVLASGSGPRAVAYVKGILTPTAAAGLSRFGAMDADWNRTHTPDPSQPAGTAYQRQADGSDKYTATTHVDGRVVGYTLHFAAPGVSQSTALTGAVSDLPSDATRVYNASASRCVVYQYRSATLASALAGSSSAGNGGRVDVILSGSGTGSGARFDPQHVVSAVVALGKPGDQNTVICP